MKKILILVTTLLLSACQTNHYLLSQGKADFEKQHYTQSLRTLIHQANKGDPEAEYAVGYLYFYGKGVTEDKPRGLYWMQRAAQQGYAPAKEALDTLKAAGYLSKD